MRDNFKKYLTGALLAGVVLVPNAAWATGGDPATRDSAIGSDEDDLDAAVDEELESGEAAEKAWSVSATLLSRVYQGTFVGLENEDPNLNPDNAKDPGYAFDRWLNLYVLDGAYTYQDFTFGAEVLWSHWLTPGGGLNEPYEVRFEDPSVSASWSGYNIEPIDTRVTAKYTASLPASDVSRTANLVLSNSLSAGLSHTFFDKLSLSYSLGGTWNAHTKKVATVDAETAQIYREDELLGNEVPSILGINTQFSLSNSFGASIPVWEDLSASIGYSITKYWTYHVDNNDEFKADADYIQTGRMTSDLSTATASLSYPIGEYVQVSGGIRTVQQPKSDDNSTFRFPWWNFDGAAGNRSAVQLVVSGSY